MTTPLDVAATAILDAGWSDRYRHALIVTGGAPRDVVTAAEAVVAVTDHKHETFASCALCGPLFEAKRELIKRGRQA